MAESINPEKLHQELKTAGLPVVSVSSTGRVDYSRSLTNTEQESANKVIAEHDPAISDKTVFLEKLALAGLSRDDVLYALWKNEIEGNDQYKERLIETMNKF
ncbi:MAG: hypothetical protein AB2L18_09345 [Anaerolineaceae bacterium]